MNCCGATREAALGHQPDRSGKHAEKFLKQLSGNLVTDGYAGYNKVENVTRFGCWAHMQRKWKEAMPKGATAENSKAVIGYKYCNELFGLEKKFAELTAEKRLLMRQEKVKPYLDEYLLWVDTLKPTKGSKLEEAVIYTKNQWELLSRFLEHGEVEISNNFAENAIRPFVIGRKNWLFSDTVKGAESSAIVYSIVETAKSNDVAPYDYLLKLLTLLPYEGKNISNERMEAFMPWNINKLVRQD